MKDAAFPLIQPRFAGSPSPALRETDCALRLLILGGTTEASGLARALVARPDVDPTLSFAGRTENPAPPPIPYRVGGFGGSRGLATFLGERGVGAVVDATHPFAARISANAVKACREAGVPLAVYTRPAWSPSLRGASATKQSSPVPLDCFAPLAMMGSEDHWSSVPDIEAAVTVLCDVALEAAATNPVILSRRRSRRVRRRTTSEPPLEADGLDALRPSTRALRARLRMMGWMGDRLRVFLTTGRLDLAQFQAAQQHHYLIRTIDPPNATELPPHATVIQARPPFTVSDEMALMRSHGIDLLVTKNSGGTAGAAKLVAARALGVPVLMIDRPPPSGAFELRTLEATLAWIETQPRRP